jgi:hypothetical protein
MKKSRILGGTLLCLTTLGLSSCIQTEPLNAECDILEVSIPGDALMRAPVVENRRVELILNSEADKTSLAPEFVLTPGATIYPPSGTVRNFTTAQTYVVTSEDGRYSKEYTVSIPREVSVYSFENVRTYSPSNGKYEYDIFCEKDDNTDDILFEWASGNSGYALTGIASTHESFPTYQIEEGYEGKAACMTTRETGSFGLRFNKPLAAGSLFLGTFDTGTALTRPLQSTHFGRQCFARPLQLRGYYKYTPGEVYKQLNSENQYVEVSGEQDRFNICGVLFDSSDGTEYLDGTNFKSWDTPQVMAIAEIPASECLTTTEWRIFDIPFVYRTDADGNPVELDAEKLKNGDYSLIVLFTSSVNGDFFAGAPGSTLVVDEVEVEFDTDNE